VTVAVNEGNPNYEVFLVDNYPGWTPVHSKDTPACLDAVAAGDADCIIISNYRYSNIAKQCEKLSLTPSPPAWSWTTASPCARGRRPSIPS
jgi:hypothetical protein